MNYANAIASSIIVGTGVLDGPQIYAVGTVPDE